ncbi:uncharacterized protein LOC131655731 [Vicia villosa]|uniref:uncharacterized protein LOC131655731 n=1 Tax=Vicia villosa TaxID=3911 RepID=UPI00273AF142|nr:uncharacterized protein LOC131655731 [Vicia villosa]
MIKKNRQPTRIKVIILITICTNFSVLKSTGARGEGNLEASFTGGSRPPNQAELCNKKVNPIVNIVDLSSDDELIKSVDSRTAKRLRTRKCKVVAYTNSPKPNRKQVVVRPVKSLSKVNVAPKKRKIRKDTESDDNVGDAQDITHVKKTVSKQSSVKVPDALMDNISFHSVDSVDRWRFVYQRRIALKRELCQDALKIKEIMDLISAVGLIKTKADFAKCYESMVKEFVVNILVDCAIPGSHNFRKVYVRGKRVHFSPAVINKYLGRSEDDGCDLEVTDNQVCREIIVNQVTTWSMRGNMSTSQLSVKYAILHRIGATKWIPTNYNSTVAVGLGKFLYIWVPKVASTMPAGTGIGNATEGAPGAQESDDRAEGRTSEKTATEDDSASGSGSGSNEED